MLEDPSRRNPVNLPSAGDRLTIGPFSNGAPVASQAVIDWEKWAMVCSIPHEEVIRWSRILVVDDDPTIVKLVRRQLQDIGYQNVLTTSEPRGALEMIVDVEPDVVLLDIVMPHVSGLTILESLRTDPALESLPVIIMTASSDPETKILSLLGGATDFLRKPLDFTELFARVRNALIAKNHQDQLQENAAALERQADELERQVELRTAELVRSRTEAIKCLARAAEYRDDDTGQHIIRVGRYVEIMANELGYSKPRVDILKQAAQLHDVGKIGISDQILLKPGRLDAHEFDMIKRHCEYGEQILLGSRGSDPDGEPDSQFTDVPNPIMSLAAVIAATHHEHWDGSGYPNGLRGEEIPVEGRITAIADVYDALSSKRPYKEPFTHEKCLAVLEEGRGTHFDPAILDAFRRCQDQVLEVRSMQEDVH